ncbi:MAG: hypothetical protein ACRCSF_00080 [Mycobacteriaceae bacterium]
MTDLVTKKQRPVDVDTGFQLWLAASVLMVVNSVAAMISSISVEPQVLPEASMRTAVFIVTGLMLFVVFSLVVICAFLLRQGHRWARSVLAFGSIFSVLQVVLGISDYEGTAGVVAAVSGILAVVLISGGFILLHRKESETFFTRASPAPSQQAPMVVSAVLPQYQQQGIVGYQVPIKPRAVEFAFWAWLGVFAVVILSEFIGVVYFVVDRQGYLEANKTLSADSGIPNVLEVAVFGWFMVVSAIVGMLIFFAFVMRRGQNWARITLTVFGGIGMFTSLLSLISLLGLAGLPGATGLLGIVQGILNLIAYGLTIFALINMYRQPVGQYFNPRYQ